MKIVVTYEPADLIRLIRQDLALQGITAEDADIKFVKNKAVVAVEVAAEAGPAIPFPGVPANLALPVVSVALSSTPAPVNNNDNASLAEMSEIQRASANLTAQNSGRFPASTRHLIDGESFDFPGIKSR